MLIISFFSLLLKEFYINYIEIIYFKNIIKREEILSNFACSSVQNKKNDIEGGMPASQPATHWTGLGLI